MLPAGRRVTLVEVARAAGVSITTVSVVLNDHHSTVRISEAIRAAIKDVAARLHSQPGGAKPTASTYYHADAPSR